LAAIAAGHWGIGAAALAVRLLAGGLSAAVLGDRGAASRLWLVPLRDLAGFAVWAGGAFGNTVMWRGRRLLLRSDGRIQPAASLDAAHDRR
jgi:ceramide glucosyltransferase